MSSFYRALCFGSLIAGFAGCNIGENNRLIQASRSLEVSTAVMDEVSMIRQAVAKRYADHLAALSEGERASDVAAAELSGSSGADLGVNLSGRGVVRSLSGYRMRIPVDAPASATAEERASRFLESHRAIFGLTRPTTKLEFLRSKVGNNGRTIAFFSQTAFGQPVFNAGLVLHVGNEGDIEWLTGIVAPDHAIGGEPPTVSAQAASSSVTGALGTPVLGWFDPEIFAREVAPVRPAWRVRALSAETEEDVYIDAGTGREILRVELVLRDTHLETFHCPNCLRASLPGNLEYDSYCETSGDAQCPAGWCWGPLGCVDPNPFPGTSDDVFLNTISTHNYYYYRHGRDSWDNAQCGQPGHPCTDPSLHRMRGSSDVGISDCNAAWHPFDIIGYKPAMVWFDDDRFCLDVVGHEFTHGVDNSEGNIDYTHCSDARTIKEGIPDVFGELIQAYDRGSTEWVHGTGCNACADARNRDLGHPENFQDICTWWGYCGGDDIPRPQPDHWSIYRKECNGHWNSTIVSKAGHLMGREAIEGVEEHWGVEVTGLGEQVAGQVWYSLMNDDYLSGAATFTDLRNAIYDACIYYALPIGRYPDCIRAIAAMGFWSSDQPVGWQVGGPVALATWTVSGQFRRYLFYKKSGSTGLALRYRPCPLGGSCSWSAETPFDTTSTGPAAAVLPGNFVMVCFRSTGGWIWCDRIDSQGNRLFGPDPGQQVEGEPSLAFFDNALYLAYRKSTGNVFWRRYTLAGGWGAETAAGFQSGLPPVLASGDEDYFAGAARNLWVVYQVSGGTRLEYRLFDTGTNTWGAARNVGQADQTPITGFRPAASVYRGRLHVGSQLADKTIWYASCAMPCNGSSTDWTRWVLQPASANGSLVLENFGAAGGYLNFWLQAPPTTDLVYRYKSSE